MSDPDLTAPPQGNAAPGAAPDLDAMIDAGTALLGIAIQPEWRDAIRLHLAISLGHAQAVLDEPVDDHLDPAPVFRA